MKNAKWITLPLALAMVCMMFTACGGGADSSGSPGSASQDEPGTAAAAGEIVLYVGMPQQTFGGLDPYLSSMTNKNYWVSCIYQQLFDVAGYGGELVSFLAEDWTLYDDNMTADVKIYENIHDTEGNHLTADDIIFSYEYSKEIGLSKMKNLEYITKLDDYTVQIKVVSDDIGMLDDMLRRVYIVCQETYEAHGRDFSSYACGTGPYKVTDYTEGATMTLEKDPDFWGNGIDMPPRGQPNADKVVLKCISETMQLSVALETGELDSILFLTGNEVDRFVNADGTAKDGYTVASVLTSGVDNLFFNMSEDSIFHDNLALRQAILYAIDTHEVLAGAVDGRGEVCYTVGSRAYADFQDEWLTEDYYWQDLDKAAELLAASGFVQSSPIRILCESSGWRKTEAQIIQNELLAIGLDCEICAYDSTLFQTCMEDSTQWDLLINYVKSTDVFPNIWNYVYDQNTSTCYWIEDDELQRLVEVVSSNEGWTDDSVKAFHAYITDNAYGYGLINTYQYVIGQDGIEAFNFRAPVDDQYGVCGITTSPGYRSNAE